MNILNYKLFLEANLDLDQLAKLKNGELRGNVLINKIKSSDPIISSDGKLVIVDKMKDKDIWVNPEEAINNLTDNDGNYDLEKAKKYLKKGNRYVPVFKDFDGDEFKINQFKKTTDFGSSGAGRQTRHFESIQCIFMLIKQMNPNVYLTPDNLIKFYEEFKEIKQEFIFLPEGIKIDDDLIVDFMNDKNWVSTFIKVPNRLWSANSNLLDKKLKYNFYHVGYNKNDSPFIAIEKKYKELSKIYNFSDINIAKYCPADVYLSSNIHNNETISLISSVNTVDQLTSVLDNLFDKKVLIPISLKKMLRTDMFRIITNKEEGKDLPEFLIKSFLIGSGVRGIASKISTESIWKHKNDKDVDIKQRVINFDSSNTNRSQNIDGEVEGTSSRHGKISFKIIKRMILSNSDININLQDYIELGILSVSKLEDMLYSLIDEISSMGDVISYPIHRGRDISGNKNKLISRIQSLQIVLSMLKIREIDREKADMIITKIMRYALSIQTDKFDTPRYLRVI